MKRTSFIYASLVLWVATSTACALLSHDPHLRLSALDRTIGSWMDGSLTGPAVNRLFNYLLDSPGVKDTYGTMPGIGSGMLVVVLLVATIITLCMWCYLLLREGISLGRRRAPAA